MATCRIGGRFPTIEFQSVDGRSYKIPQDLQGSIAVVLFYRGHW